MTNPRLTTRDTMAAHEGPDGEPVVYPPHEELVGDVWDAYEPDGFDLDTAVQRHAVREAIVDLQEQIAAAILAEPEPDEELLAQLNAEMGEAMEEAERLGDDPHPLDPDDERRAGWAMRRLAEYEDRLDHVAEHRRARYAEIEEWVHAHVGEAQRALDAWYDRESTRAERSAAYFRGMLEAAAAGKFEAALRDKLPAAAKRLNDGATAEELRAEAWRLVKHKTLDLPEGRVEARTTPWKAEVLDPDRFVEWAQAHGADELLNVKVSPALTPMRNRLRRSVILGDAITVRPADPGTLRREYERTDELLATTRARAGRLDDLAEITGGLGLTDGERAELEGMPDRLALLTEAAAGAREAWLAAQDGEVPEPAPVPGVRMIPPAIGYTVKPDRAQPEAEE